MAEVQQATIHQRDGVGSVDSPLKKDDTVATSRKNSKNRKSDRGGKGMYVHNLGACSLYSKEDQLVSSIFFYLYIYLNNYFYIFFG